jgi:hypothetical protein
VAELVVRGVEPARVRLDAHERADVFLEVDVPTGGVRVLLALLAFFDRVEIGFRPEARRERLEPEPGVELLGRLRDPFRIAALEAVVDVRRLDEAGPFLAPAVVDPMRGMRFGTGCLYFSASLCFVQVWSWR